MNDQQQAAISQPCYLPEETINDRFYQRRGTHSILLTVNAGFE